MTISPFQGDTITLRPFGPDDVPALAGYLNHPDLAGRRYIPWSFPEFAPLSQQQVEGICQKWSKAEKGLNLAVVQTETQILSGHAECDWGWDPHCPSLSLVIAPDHQRQGYGSEVLDLLLDYLFGYTPAHVITCWISDWNRSGLGFVAKHDFQQAGRMRRAGMRAGHDYDLIVTDLLRPEWKKEGGASHAA